MNGRILLGAATGLHKTQSKTISRLIPNTPLTLRSPLRAFRRTNMSPVTALLAATAVPPAYSSSAAVAPRHARPSVGFPLPGGARAALAVECSSRPQKKGTKHHMKTRPKKTQRWDIKRRPTQYPPLPALPPDWTLVASSATVDADAAPQQEEEAPAPVLELAAAVAPAAAD